MWCARLRARRLLRQVRGRRAGATSPAWRIHCVGEVQRQGLGKIGPLRHAGQTNIAKALRHNARNHRRPLPLLGIT